MKRVKRLKGFTLMDMLTSMLVIILLVGTFFSFYIWINGYLTKYYQASVSTSENLELLMQINSRVKGAELVKLNYETGYIEIYKPKFDVEKIHFENGKFEWYVGDHMISGSTSIKIVYDSLSFYNESNVIKTIGVLIDGPKGENYITIQTNPDEVTKYYLEKKSGDEVI